MPVARWEDVWPVGARKALLQMAKRLMLAGWAWCDLCKQKAGFLLDFRKTTPSGQHGSGSSHGPENQ